MSLHLFDSATRELREFVPVRPGHVGMYVCGATPQSAPHIGHVRAQVSFDVMRRWFERSGLTVTLVRNVTDIDDKILTKSAEAGRTWWAHAYHFEQAFTSAYDAVGIQRPTIEPRATGHIMEMIELIQILIDKGHAYPAADGSSDVYFDVRSFAEYGALTHQKLDDMEAATDADPRGKRDPRDFALWKSVKPDEPQDASWNTPWGPGRPGWHIECSAMAARYLGEEFDIHGGGLDLRFPHHENEQAQSRAAGHGFAQFWMHNGLVVQAGEKMSKSLGNVLSVPVILEEHEPIVLRYLLASAHYRSTLEVSPASLEEAAAAFERIRGFVTRAAEAAPAVADLSAADLADVQLPEAFVAAMNNDISVPAALAVLHETVGAGNTALADGNTEAAQQSAAQVRAMADVLGVDPLGALTTASGGGDDAHEALDALIQERLAARAQARADKDFAAADGIRDALIAAGIAVEDTPDGARWSLARNAGQ